MARYDFWSELNQFLPQQPHPEDERETQIDKIFFEVAEELGLTDIDSMPGNDAAELGTVVYDKFSARPR